ncbi:MAG: right-handed parallel beta-helix repeat-containing protein [Bacteroidales bacterium]
MNESKWGIRSERSFTTYRKTKSVVLLFSVITLFVITFLPLTSNGQIAFRHDTLTYSQTWVKDTTYIIDQDLYVPENIVLRINPGVQILINQGIGIFIEQGSFLVTGLEENVVDSVQFKPNYLLPNDDWKWRGIKFKDAAIENGNMIEFANISNTEIGIEMENCHNVIIRNSLIWRNQWRGIKIFNSDHCVISDCFISEGYLGIEIYASGLGNTASFNLVNTCLIKAQSTGILIWGRNRGLNTYNLISGSRLIGNDNGIQLDNGISVYGKNFIEKNIISNRNLLSGYGVQVRQDSTELKNNIIWRNLMGVELRSSTNCEISSNSFHENQTGLLIGDGSVSSTVYRNTFTENKVRSISFVESENVNYLINNHLSNTLIPNSIQNNSSEDISVIQNYWGVTESEIGQLFFDHSDNQLLGTFIYQPFLEDPDTINPISIPFGAIKQQLGNQVRVSWNRSRESDQKSHKVYAGNFVNYTFANSYGLTQDSVFLLNDVNIHDSIAVTALDALSDWDQHQLTGHESPFAFATIAPYAGEDLFICENQSGINLEMASAPFDQSTVEWTSSGDGSFIDPFVLHPKYFPGNMDKLHNSVTLYFNVYQNTRVLKDSLRVYLFDFPTVDLGNDTTILNDALVKIVGIEAVGFEELKWETLGDGFFSSDTVINPVYTPGNLDILNQSVDLVLTATSNCGSISDTIRIYILPYASVNGRLWSGDQKMSRAVVLATQKSEEGWKIRQIVRPDLLGNFKFERLLYGNYLFTAVPDTSYESDAVTTHYVNQTDWQEGYVIDLDKDTYDVDIHLQSIDYRLPSGEGSISGQFLMPASASFSNDLYCEEWFSAIGQTNCTEGLSNISLLLFNQTHEKILDFALTNEEGKFYFNNLPFGTYFIEAVIPGFSTVQLSTIQLNSEHKRIDGVNLNIENEKKIVVRFTDEILIEGFNIYPNPVSETLYLEIPEGFGEKIHIEFYSLLGIKKFEYDNLENENSIGTIDISVSNLETGVYIGKLISKELEMRFVFIRK